MKESSSVSGGVGGLVRPTPGGKGLITLTADAAYQGASGGRPRNVDKPAYRIEDIHGMADFIARYPGVDGVRLGLDGVRDMTNMSLLGGGGAAEDVRVRELEEDD